MHSTEVEPKQASSKQSKQSEQVSSQAQQSESKQSERVSSQAQQSKESKKSKWLQQRADYTGLFKAAVSEEYCQELLKILNEQKLPIDPREFHSTFAYDVKDPAVFAMLMGCVGRPISLIVTAILYNGKDIIFRVVVDEKDRDIYVSGSEAHLTASHAVTPYLAGLLKEGDGKSTIIKLTSFAVAATFTYSSGR